MDRKREDHWGQMDLWWGIPVWDLLGRTCNTIEWFSAHRKLKQIWDMYHCLAVWLSWLDISVLKFQNCRNQSSLAKARETINKHLPSSLHLDCRQTFVRPPTYEESCQKQRTVSRAPIRQIQEGSFRICCHLGRGWDLRILSALVIDHSNFLHILHILDR